MLHMLVPLCIPLISPFPTAPTPSQDKKVSKGNGNPNPLPGFLRSFPAQSSASNCITPGKHQLMCSLLRFSRSVRHVLRAKRAWLPLPLSPYVLFFVLRGIVKVSILHRRAYREGLRFATSDASHLKAMHHTPPQTPIRTRKLKHGESEIDIAALRAKRTPTDAGDHN